jgi:hypothetical protein
MQLPAGGRRPTVESWRGSTLRQMLVEIEAEALLPGDDAK